MKKFLIPNFLKKQFFFSHVEMLIIKYNILFNNNNYYLFMNQTKII